MEFDKWLPDWHKTERLQLPKAENINADEVVLLGYRRIESDGADGLSKDLVTGRYYERAKNLTNVWSFLIVAKSDAMPLRFRD